MLVDDHTHIEGVRYPRGSDVISLLTTVLTDGGRGPRWLHWLGALLRAPLRALRLLIPFGFAVRSVILLVMQPVDSHLRYRLRRRWWWPFSRKLDSAPGAGPRVPVYLPIANEVARRLAKKMDGDPQSCIVEVLTNKSTTAHILGGCPIGAGPEDGVVGSPLARLRLRALLHRRRLDHPGQPRRQPQPHHHRHGRARHEPRPAKDRILRASE